MKKAIREGEIKLGSITLKVAVLEDGTRVIKDEGILMMLTAPVGSYTQEEAVAAMRQIQTL